MFNISITERGHQILRNYIEKGDVAVDCTAGHGNDTLFLADCVGESGVVHAFEIQNSAIEELRRKFKDYPQVNIHPVSNVELGEYICRACAPASGSANASSKNLRVKESECAVKNSAERTEEFRQVANAQRPKVIMYNLGYLPGGDYSITTTSEETIASIQNACNLLLPKGVLSIVAYPGHPEGAREAAAVEGFLSSLPSANYEVLTFHQTNRSRNTPVQHMVYKSRDSKIN